MTKTKVKATKATTITKERTLKIYSSVFLYRGLGGKPFVAGR